MDRLTQDAFERLVAPHAGPCISIYLEGGEAGSPPAALRLRYILATLGQRLAEVEPALKSEIEWLAPLEQFASELELRPNQRAPLALFAAPDSFAVYQLPAPGRELVTVGARFHVKPLLPLLAMNGVQYHLLALSKNQVRLFHGVGPLLEAVELPGAPANLAETLQYDEFGPELQYHSAMPGRGGERGPIYHGQGDTNDSLKSELERYCRQIDRALTRLLAQSRAPLVLSGVDYLLAIYRAVSAYPLILEATVSGSPGHLSAAELGARAWTLVENQLQLAQQQALERYAALTAKDPLHIASTVRLIVPAAEMGRVDTLFVARDREQWGRYGPGDALISEHEQPEPGDEDLLDRAALHTLAHRGQVYPMPADQVPGDGLCAAIFRP